MSEGENKMQPGRKGINKRELLIGAGWAFNALLGGRLLAQEAQRRRHDIYTLFLSLTNDPSEESYHRTLRFIEAQYGVRVRFDYANKADIRGEGVPFSMRRDALSRLLTTLYKYPVDYFRNNDLPRIRFVMNLSVHQVQENQQGGTTSGIEGAGGVAERETDTIYLLADTNASSLYTAIDHELFHNFFQRLGSGEDIRQWQAIMDTYVLAKGEIGPFEYAGYTVGRQLRDRELFSGAFVREYGASTIAEDMATVAEALMNPRRYVSFLEEFKSLPRESPERVVLQNKINFIKAKYLEWSLGEMDEGYWEELLRIDHQPSYSSSSSDDNNAIVVTGNSYYDPRETVGPERYDSFYALTPERQKRELEFIQASNPHLFPYERN